MLLRPGCAPGTRVLLQVGAAAGGLSAGYFLALVSGVTSYAGIGVLVGCVLGVFIWFKKRRAGRPTPASNAQESGLRSVVLAALLLALGAACAYLCRWYGDYDAALIWNLHARYLARGAGWTALFAPHHSGNPAHPLGLPSLVAFFWRLGGSTHPVVPFLAGLLPTLAIPTILFLESGGRRLWKPTAAFLLFAANPYFLNIGLDQYADVWVAALFLGACVAARVYRTSRGNAWAAACGCALGMLVWWKSEGAMLAAILLLFHAPLRCSRRALACTLAGAAPFLTAFFILRVGYAPSHPVVEGVAAGTWRLATDGDRISLVAQYLLRAVAGPYGGVAAALILYLARCASRRCVPHRDVVLPLVCAAGYCAVYLTLTVNGLQWNLATSLNRVLMHCTPALILALAQQWSASGPRQSLRVPLGHGSVRQAF